MFKNTFLRHSINAGIFVNGQQNIVLFICSEFTKTDFEQFLA
jgi:hypothetical protein